MRAIEDGPVPPALDEAEARAFLRVGAGADNAVLASLLASVSALAERFTGVTLIRRTISETLPVAPGCWQALGRAPVNAISAVEGLAIDGTTTALPITDYAIDIDARADGWVRVDRADGFGRLRISYTAGVAVDASGVPEGLRQGMLLLAAHLHRERDRETPADPPAAVAALWRPWRRMRLGWPVR